MKKLINRKRIVLLFLVSSPIIVFGAFLKIMLHNEMDGIANAIILLGIFLNSVSLILFFVSFLIRQDSIRQDSNPQLGR